MLQVLLPILEYTQVCLRMTLLPHGSHDEIKHPIAVILQFNRGFGQELIGLHAKILVLAYQDVKMQSTPNEPIWNILCSNFHTNSNHAPKSYQTWKVFYAKPPTPNQISRRTLVRVPIFE